MHIAMNGWFWSRPSVGSGLYTRQLIYHLNRYISDLRITLVLPQVGDAPLPDDIPPSVETVYVPTRGGHIGKVLFEQRGFPRACEQVGADLAHVPYWGAPLRSSLPLVVTIHDLTTLLVPEYRRSAKARLYNALVSASARGADHIITDSFAAKIDIIDYLGIADDDISAIYLAHAPGFSPDGNVVLDMAIRTKYDLPEFYVLYLGGYEIHKNVTQLLLAFTYVNKAVGDDYPLVLAGKKPSPSAHVPDYDAYIEKLGLTEQVQWIGYVDEADKATVYREAEVFVFPSSAEGFGLPPLEAMACGVPVVTTDAGSLPEVVGGAAFAVNPDDERDMAGAIIATIVQENVSAELRAKGPVQAATFSWEKTATETLLVYDEVLRKS